MNWFTRLKSGLSKTSTKLAGGITGIFTKRKLDKETLQELEELLLQADIGAKLSAKIVSELSSQRLDKEISPQEINDFLANEISKILTPFALPLTIDITKKPYVILVVGVNGNGKTTTIGKITRNLQAQHYKVMLAAADTFRAAAVEQLAVWAERNKCVLIKGEPNADPASVAYKALEKAKSEDMDVLMIDTAGRLHNKSNLMAELQKMIKVIRKLDADAPHAVIQVLDATTGQNALNQVEVFKQMVDVSGLVITKLDGTAKGGIVVALADKFALPVHAVGVGEGIEDLQPFSATEFARNMVGST